MIRTRKLLRTVGTSPVNFSLCFLAIALLVTSSPTALAQPVVSIGQNFTASTSGVDTSAVPPDSDGAVGPLHYVEFVNGRVSIFLKSDGTKVKTMTDLAFWSQAGINIRSGWDVTDPRIVYDPPSQRWFASQVDFDTTGTVNTNHFLLAVSATSDPTGTWKAFSIPTDPGGNDFADYPTLGLDSQGVYLAGDMFDVNSNPVGPTLASIPKASLLSNPPTTSGLNWFGVLNYNVRGEILQPVFCFDGSGVGNVLAVGSIGIDNSGNFVTNTQLVVTQIKNPAGPAKPTISSTQMTVPPYTAPLNPAQPDGSNNLDDGDARLSGSVCELNGVIYAVHSTQIGNLAAIRWYRIDATNQAILESGTIVDPVKDLYYPSIAANPAGTVIIACSGSSSFTFPSSFVIPGSIINGVTIFGAPIQLQAGTASYQNPDPSFGNTSRWGDYSATWVDPVDPTRFWTIQEIATGASTWSTQVTELLTGPPNLSISTSGNTLLLSWTGTSYGLQTTSDLATPTWTAVAQNLSTNNGVITAQLPISQVQAFFRLQ